LASTKIYTKTGDKGTTSLVNGDRVPKSHLRLETYGSVDELNSVIGLLRTHLQSYAFHAADEVLKITQNHLFNLGSQLACADAKIAKTLPQISEEHIVELEKEMDAMSKDLPPLKNFILPGGHILASHAHLARTVCRRVERACCRLAETDSVPDAGIAYLNRLNDYFFVLARFFNHSLGVEEVIWEK
jgi:cob(I)alamin adenosyltransferase